MSMRTTLTAAGVVVGLAVSAQAATLDFTTSGTWVGTYGGDGYVLSNWNDPNDLQNLPSYVSSVTYSGESRFTWNGATLDPRAVQDPSNLGGNRKAATTYSGGT